MKNFLAVLLALVLILSLCACGVDVTTTTTTTETHTDADGTTTSTTTSVVNGEETTVNTVTDADGNEVTDAETMGDLAADGESHEVNAVIVNNTDKNMIGLYITEVGAEYAGDNAFPEDLVLAPGESSDIFTLTYSKDGLIQADIGGEFEGEEGIVWYTECDFSGCDPDDFVLEFTMEDDGYHLYF